MDFRGIKVVCAIALSVTAAGCADLVWVGPNPDGDIGACTAEASAAFPPAIYSYQSGGGYTTPIRTSCNSYGSQTNCISTGGVYVPPAQSLADANSGSRKEYFGRCMVSRGNRLMTRSDYQNLAKSQPPQPRRADSPVKRDPSAPRCAGGKYSLNYDPLVCE